MTRETKIGLLVGLAFIIFFGIILSEKGTGPNQLTTPQIAAYKPSPVREFASPADNNGLEVSHSQRPPAAGPRRSDSMTSQQTPTTIQHNSTNNTGNAGQHREEANPPPQQQPTLAPAIRDMLPAQPTRALVEIPASGPSNVDPNLRQLAQSARAPQLLGSTETKPKPVFKLHRVQPGETLGGICHLNYPGQAYKMVRRVMALNDISAPEKLRAGQTLKLPVQTIVEGISQPAVLVSVPTSPIGSTSKLIRIAPTGDNTTIVHTEKRPSTTKQWYVVKSSDTLSRIAERFYGTQRAWRELYKVNRDIITDPHVVRSGLKIRLPEQIPTLAVGRPVQ